MKCGDIVFFKHDSSFIGKSISFLTKSPYTHVAIAINSTQILEADAFIKCRIRTLTDDHKVYKIKSLTVPYNQTKLLAEALKFVGCKYDYWAIATWAVNLAFKWNIPLVQRANHLYCSELVDTVYQNCGIDLMPQDWTGDVTPAMLFDSPLLEESL